MQALKTFKGSIDTYNILVIEDNPGDFTLIEEFLSEQIKNPQITHAGTYRKAKSILSDKSNVLDVILLDLSLPDKTGSELINDIVELNGNIPIIILTGYESSDFGVKSLSMGISDYILKDELTPQLLHKSILHSIERRKLNLYMFNYIKTIEEQNKKLMDIAWIQSHMVRAPLARIMGLVDLFNNHENTFSDERQIMDYIANSATDLDRIIQNITDKVYSGIDLSEAYSNKNEYKLQNL